MFEAGINKINNAYVRLIHIFYTTRKNSMAGYCCGTFDALIYCIRSAWPGCISAPLVVVANLPVAIRLRPLLPQFVLVVEAHPTPRFQLFLTQSRLCRYS